MKRVLGMLMAMAMLLASMTGASALTFSAWEDEIPPLAVSEAVAKQIAEDTAVENGFQLNDVTLLHAATKLVKADDTGRPIWVVSRTYMENDTEQLHQYHAIIDAQTGEIQYDTKFYFEKMHDWESELQCDSDFWPYEKYYLFCHVYIPEYIPTAMPEESRLTLEEVRSVCDYRIREWSGFTLSQEELDAYTMTARYSKRPEYTYGMWDAWYYLLDPDEPQYHLEFAYQVSFSDDTLDAIVYSWEELHQGGLG